jgi:nucleoside phosphorylase
MRKNSHRDYTVGWICALSLELAASEAMFTENHDPLPQPKNDHNNYILGAVHGHNVAMACLPSGVYGTTPAAVVATQMLSTFPSIEFGLMVGIGGAAPSKLTDIRLGDVVVSKPTKNLPGVVQYDFGKLMRDGVFQTTGTLNKPPQVLLTAIATLEAEYRVNKRKIKEILSDLRLKEPTMPHLNYPGQDRDQLFKVEYDHVGQGFTCDECDLTMLETRSRRSSDDPQVHYGIIASANQVMKCGRTRETLRNEHGMLCFEMEAAGLMDKLPCLVIRGMCDYSDSHKNKRWQDYAAVTAAAYAKELLSLVPTTGVEKFEMRSLSGKLSYHTPPQYEEDILVSFHHFPQEYCTLAIPHGLKPRNLTGFAHRVLWK